MKPNIFQKSTFGLFVVPLSFTLGNQIVYAQAENITEPAGARVLETGVLQIVPGFTGDALGAEVIAVTPGENDTQVIDIVIPVNPDDVDRIRVLTPDGKPLKPERAIEISMDHENKEVGVVLTLSRKDRLGFKFRLIDLPDDQ